MQSFALVIHQGNSKQFKANTELSAVLPKLRWRAVLVKVISTQMKVRLFCPEWTRFPTKVRTRSCSQILRKGKHLIRPTLSVWIFFRYSALEMLRFLGSHLLTVDAKPLKILLQKTIQVSDIDAHLSHLVRNFLSTLFLWVTIYFNLYFFFLTLKCITLIVKPTVLSESQDFYMYQQC